MSIVRHQVFGKDEHPTVYCLTGYTGRISQYKLHINSLMAAGFRVVAFEYDRSIFDSGDPQVLIDALDDIEAVVKADMKDRVAAGVYGTSLGSFLGYNVLYDCGMTHAVFNAGGAHVPGAIWNRPRLGKVKTAFERSGYDFERLTEVWAHMDPTMPRAAKKRKTILMLNSTADELIDINEARRTVAMWQGQGDTVTLIVGRGMRHAHSIVRHMLRVRRVSEFFRDAVRHQG